MPKVNRAAQLLAAGQPIFNVGTRGRGYEAGREIAGTWADGIVYDMEHGAFDIGELREFMRGLREAGPTRSGHPTPAVLVTLPFDGISETVVRANNWVIKQVLASGVHGLMLCHAESPEAVKAFVECARYPFNTLGLGQGLDVGRRGGGGQAHAAEVWGVSTREYLDIADPWPINPQGELMLGVKIENVRALSNVEMTMTVPGIAYAEWGPGDMGMSLGFPDNHDEPYPAPMQAARARILAACKHNGVAFLSGVYTRDVIERVEEGVRVCHSRDGREAADLARTHFGRTMPA